MVAATEPSTIQKAVQIIGILTDEALRNGLIKKNHEKRGMGENLVRIGMEGMITRGLGLKMLLPQPLICETDIQEKEQKENQRQTNPSTEWKGQSQKSSK
ncbi:hypothetical protein Tco_0354469 [Tanacetum coccineum]